MLKFKYIVVLLAITLAVVGCSKKPPEESSGWNTVPTDETTDESTDETTGPDESTDETTDESTDETTGPTESTDETTGPTESTDETTGPDENTEDDEEEVDTGFKSVDLTLGRPKSTLYTYVISSHSTMISELLPSTTHEGFFDAKTSQGKYVLLSPDYKPVVHPSSAEFKVIEPFLSGDTVYFRVESMSTDWQEIPEIYNDQWWKPLGEYAVVDEKGKEVIPFGRFDYIDRYVDGLARAYSVEDENYYIIDGKGEILKTYAVSDKEAPYKLYKDGYIYMRSDVDRHSHALVTWDGEIVIPYGVYKDDFFPKYIGDDTFLVSNDILLDGTESGLILYSVNKEQRELPEDSYDVFSGNDNKYVTGMITNGLAGPLAVWEYVVTDYAGKILIEQGKYTFNLGGWGGGYAVAKNKENKLVLLDEDCKEVSLPENMELTGRYSLDAALFTVKLTKDFEMWRYTGVPTRYDNPVGVVDREFNWVIPPGEIDYVRNLPIPSLHIFSEYKKGDVTKKGSLIQVTPID